MDKTKELVKKIKKARGKTPNDTVKTLLYNLVYNDDIKWLLIEHIQNGHKEYIHGWSDDEVTKLWIGSYSVIVTKTQVRILNMMKKLIFDT